MLTIAPGLSRGIDFSSKNAKPTTEEFTSNLQPIDFQNIMEDFGDLSLSSAENQNESIKTEHQSHELEALVVPKVIYSLVIT